MIHRLKYGNTNCFVIDGNNGCLMIDTDMPGTLNGLYRSLKEHEIAFKDIRFLVATHFHPDHIGLVSELMSKGIRLILLEEQIPYVHFADRIFERDGNISYEPIKEDTAMIVSCSKSRELLTALGFDGEIIYTPRHSMDSISLIMDDGTCFAGDLEPIEYLEAYENNELKNDWDKIMEHNPRKVYFSHRNEIIFG